MPTPTMISFRSNWSDQNHGTLSCGVGSAEQIQRHGGALLEGVVDRLQAQVPAVLAVEVARAVAGGVDGLIGGAAVRVRHHAVLALESGGLRQFIRRHDADADEHDVGRVFAAVLGEHRAHAPAVRIGVQRAHPRIAVDAHALAGVLGGVEGGHLPGRSRGS